MRLDRIGLIVTIIALRIIKEKTITKVVPETNPNELSTWLSITGVSRQSPCEIMRCCGKEREEPAHFSHVHGGEREFHVPAVGGRMQEERTPAEWRCWINATSRGAIVGVCALYVGHHQGKPTSMHARRARRRIEENSVFGNWRKSIRRGGEFVGGEWRWMRKWS